MADKRAKSPKASLTVPDGMLKLPLNARSRCGCIPMVSVVLAILIGIGARAWFLSRNAPAAPTVVVTRPNPVVEPTATFTLTPLPPVPDDTPTATSVPTRTPVPVVVPTATPVLTATPVPTATATATPVPTRRPTITFTPRPTDTPSPTDTPMPTQDAGTAGTRDQAASGRIVCDATVRSVIERAADAQAQYMEGTLPSGALAETWGRAAGDAQIQAERMISYQRIGILGVEIRSVTWQLLSCDMALYDNWAQVAVSERWQYTAELACASGTKHTSVWDETFPSESYALVRGPEGWQIESWLTGAAVSDAKWACP